MNFSKYIHVFLRTNDNFGLYFSSYTILWSEICPILNFQLFGYTLMRVTAIGGFTL